MTILESETRYWKKNEEYSRKELEHIEKVVNWLEELQELKSIINKIAVETQRVRKCTCDDYDELFNDFLNNIECIIEDYVIESEG